MGRPKAPRLVCEYCKREFPKPKQRGPVPKFCSAAHRQRNYEETKVKRLQQETRQLRRKLVAATTALSLSTMRARRGNEAAFHEALEKLDEELVAA